MLWALGLREKASGMVVMVTAGMRVDVDDETYEPDVHIVPCKEVRGEHTFGSHDFTRQCYCKPEIRQKVNGRDQVIHKDSVQ